MAAIDGLIVDWQRTVIYTLCWGGRRFVVCCPSSFVAHRRLFKLLPKLERASFVFATWVVVMVLPIVRSLHPSHRAPTASAPQNPRTEVSPLLCNAYIYRMHLPGHHESSIFIHAIQIIPVQAGTHSPWTSRFCFLPCNVSGRRVCCCHQCVGWCACTSQWLILSRCWDGMGVGSFCWDVAVKPRYSGTAIFHNLSLDPFSKSRSSCSGAWHFGRGPGHLGAQLWCQGIHAYARHEPG